MLLIPSLKKKTRECPIVPLADPKDLYLPLDGYRGDLTPVARDGESVRKYQLLAESTGTFAGKLHAPVSGTVIGRKNINGKVVLHLENDFQDREADRIPIDPRRLAPENFARLLLDRGVVGAGGARLPTHLKYSGPTDKIHIVIFNGAECEPYLSADHALMDEHPEELLRAAGVIGTVVGAGRLVFAIEQQNRRLRKGLLKAAGKLGLPIEVKLLPDSYPQGGELQLIRSVTGLELKRGSLPAAHGILVNNVGTLHAIYQAIFEGTPCTGRVLTVSGEKGGRAGNYRVKIGTPVEHILRETGGSWDPENQRVILGGAMMGKAVDSPLTPVHKGAGGLLVLRRKKLAAYNCIGCGVCVDVCPQRLMLLEFARAH
ncbi:MAG: RnfABCDGE type electron transport complex subunit C, partial [Verrucomicrobiaceae bacterium]